jgi:hypothetical protein
MRGGRVFAFGDLFQPSTKARFACRASLSAKRGTLLRKSPLSNSVFSLIVRDPANGTVALQPDGSFTYRPDIGFVGVDSFTYRARNPGASLATVRITGAGDRCRTAPRDARRMRGQAVVSSTQTPAKALF